ncbi:sulfatase [Labilibacter sediminis]|nr:sulfatase [Labilibacter sediminis]
MRNIVLLIIIHIAAISMAQQKPNIVLIVADDHGTDALGCYGNSVIKTPAMDALAMDGIRFNNAYCTSASCSASRSTLLTGKYNHAIGHYGHEHAFHHFSTFNKEKSLMHYLEKGGYRTARVGKYHLAPEKVYHFQEVFKANLRNPVQMANVCADFIADQSEPFFLYYCTSDPHRDGKTVDVAYQPNSFGNREDGFYPGVIEQHYSPEEVIVPEFLPNTPECRAELAQYYQSVSRLDQGVGRLVELLKQQDVYDNTIIIYISDNGIAFPGAKTTVYEPGIKLPCIIKHQNQKHASTVSNALISWVDLTPTVLTIAGLFPEKNSFHGKAFDKVLQDPDFSVQDEIYASHTFHEVTMYYPMRVIRDKKFKFIYNIAHQLDYPCAADLWESPTWQSVYKKGENSMYGQRKVKDYLHRSKFELYDLEKDPGEALNLAEKQNYQQLVEAFVVKMKQFQEDTKDPWIVKWEHE